MRMKVADLFLPKHDGYAAARMAEFVYTAHVAGLLHMCSLQQVDHHTKQYSSATLPLTTQPSNGCTGLFPLGLLILSVQL